MFALSMPEVSAGCAIAVVAAKAKVENRDLNIFIVCEMRCFRANDSY